MLSKQSQDAVHVRPTKIKGLIPGYPLRVGSDIPGSHLVEIGYLLYSRSIQKVHKYSITFSTMELSNILYS